MKASDPFALPAAEFFQRFRGESLTFDDLHVLQPRTIDFGVGEVDLSTRITRNIRIKTPLVSSPMEDISEHQLAIAVALQGFPAVIHCNLSVEEQAAQVRRVKRFENGFVQDPITLGPEDDTRGMAHGGTTTHIDFCYVRPGTTIPQALESRATRWKAIPRC